VKVCSILRFSAGFGGCSTFQRIFVAEWVSRTEEALPPKLKSMVGGATLGKPMTGKGR
jgi:hypothetical protein